MEKVTSMEDFKKEAKRREFAEKRDQCVTWVNNNLGFVTAVAIPVFVALVKGGTAIGKRILANRRVVNEMYYKQTHYYDPSSRHKWELRRALTNKEWEIFEIRRAGGESVYNIFKAMDVLK